MTRRLGDFQLTHALGQGGMGEVWCGFHPKSPWPVAVKLLEIRGPTASATWSPDGVGSSGAFYDEARAAASLSHPNVVAIYDYGVAPAEGALGSGTPYLVMELATGGTAADLRLPAWREVRTHLLELLDALAHAHAHGVIHRDVKPSNILFCAATDMRPGLRLADFGIAWLARDPDRDLPARVGTPAFLAPEQAFGQWWELGPWTDLYALGCVAWWMLSGRNLFLGRSTDVVQAHATAPRPDLQGVIGAPEGLEGWLHRLLIPDPARRTQHAASAAADLLALDGLATPVQKSWGTRGVVEAAVASPALFGMRPIPLAGRVSERDRLWEQFLAVQRDRRARVVVLRGVAGVGKSRLADWLATRVQELGIGRALRASHSGDGGPDDGLTSMFRWFFRYDGTDSARLAALPARIRACLTPLLGAQAAPRRGERHGLYRGLLSEIASDGVAVGVFDDVQWGFDALLLAIELLRAQERAPSAVLLVLTLREEELSDNPIVQALVSQLVAMPHVASIEVPPLDAVETRELVCGLLRLAGPVAALVEERSAGNPAFAVQLVADWLERGVLHEADDGLRLSVESDVPLPDSLLHAWQGRVETLLSGWTDAERRALELAAILGPDVDIEEWHGLCAIAGVPPRARLRELEQRGLVRFRGDRVWSFSHGIVPEAIRGRLGAKGAGDHLFAAEVLRAGGMATARRRGRHLLAAGAFAEAFEPLRRGARFALIHDEVHTAEALGEQLEQVLHKLETSEDDRAWAQRDLLAVAVQYRKGARAEARSLAERVSARAERHGWTAIRATAETELARLSLDSGDALKALERLQLLPVEDLDDYAVGVQARSLLAVGRLDEAEALLQPLMHTTELHYRAVFAFALAKIQSRRGDGGAAYLLAMDLARAAGSPLGQAAAANDLGDLAREGGDLHRAERWYTQALELLRAVDHPNALVTRVNLALIAMEHGDLTRAAASVQPWLPHFQHWGLVPMLVPALLAVAAGAIARGDRVALETHLSQAARLQADAGIRHLDLARIAELVAAATERVGWLEEAGRLRRWLPSLLPH